MDARHIWLKDRTIKCIEELSKIISIEDWTEYRKMAKEISTELLYAVTEWEEYYRAINV